MIIRITPIARSKRPIDQTTVPAQSVRRTRKVKIASTSIALYAGLFVTIVGFIAYGANTPKDVSVLANANSVASARSNDSIDHSAVDITSVDKLVATRLAANIAQTANLPVASNVANLSQSLAAENSLTKTEENIVAKPQIVQPTAAKRDIKRYTAVAGDTVTAVAKKYGVSAQTVQWANGLTSDALEPGKSLDIPPVDGVVYTVKAGDTLESISEKYKSDKSQVVSFNDLELGGLDNGKKVIIPNGTLPENERPGYTAPRTSRSTYATANTNTFGSYAGGSGRANDLSRSGSNTYAFGNCTWYAYERRIQLGLPVGAFWGNAATWAYYGASSGLLVDGNPGPGAIMANGGGYGHVAIVESVNPGVSITISEMNGYRFGGGFNRIGRGDIDWSEAVSGRYKYIH